MNKMTLIIALALGIFGFSSANANGTQEPKEMQIGISDAYIPGGFDSTSDAFVVAHGIFPNGCYRWARAEVTHNGNIHEVKSFAKVQQGMCLMVLVPFTKEVPLGQLSSGNHQVRFLNGDGTYLEKSLVVE